MTLVIKTNLPQGALHAKYLASDGYHTDCFETEVEGDISLAQFIEAFYTGRLFKLERLILRYTIRRPSTDTQAREIAQGLITQFAAWDLEDRTETQAILVDLRQATRSWFMIEPLERGTRLRFGSVVAPVAGTKDLPKLLRPLMRFHELYSKLLIKGAVKRLKAGA